MKQKTEFFAILLLSAVTLLTSCGGNAPGPASLKKNSSSPSAVEAKDKIEYRLIDETTLEISGNGDVHNLNPALSKEEEKKIKTLIVKEGITGISARICSIVNEHHLNSLTSVVLPNSLTTLGEDVFSEGEFIETVQFGNNLKNVGADAFAYCSHLREMNLPDSVQTIGSDAFYKCNQLEKLTVPKSLKEWPDAIGSCPSLKTIENHSDVPVEICQYKKYISWIVDGKKTTTIGPGKTGTASAKKMPLKYYLHGGTATGDLPDCYTFGTNFKLPDCVEKKGWQFMGWLVDYEETCDYIVAGRKTKSVEAIWMQYELKSTKPGTVTATLIDDSSYFEYAVGCAETMAELEEGFDDEYDPRVHFFPFDPPEKNNYNMTIKGLESGKTYYFLLAGADDQYIDWLPRSVQKVVVK